MNIHLLPWVFAAALINSFLGAQAAPRNVLFIVSDDLTACLGSYGHPLCKTPHLDRLASEGVRFTKAYCQYPLCGPSRASFMSGLYPESNGVLGNADVLGSYRTVTPSLANHPSLAGFLKDHGYFTARVSKIFHMGVPGGIEQGAPGGDDPASWDFAQNILGPETLSPGVRELLSPNRRHYGSSFAVVRIPDSLAETQTDALTTTQALAILESRAHSPIEGATNKLKTKPAAPFFLAVGLVRPHVPLVAPERHFARYPVKQLALPAYPDDDLKDVPKPGRVGSNDGHYGMTEDQQKRAIAAYYASVSFMDDQVGRLLSALDRLKLRETTIVVFLSDHGWNLGEHGCWQKLGLWDESTRVPLLISAPGFSKSRGRPCQDLVELIDLYPTLADLCGLGANAPARLQGRSLKPHLEAPETLTQDRVAYTLTTGKARSLRQGRWRYSDWGRAGTELYDLANDPKEITNLAESAAAQDIRRRLATLLDRKTADARAALK